MKRYLLLICFLLLAGTCFFKSAASPSCTVILDKTAGTIPLPNLYYSDLSGRKVSAYSIQGNALHLNKEKMISFTEGFLPKTTYDFYMHLLENFTDNSNLPVPVSLHDFYEDDQYVVLSFSGTLKDIYIIEKNNSRVHPLIYAPSLDLGAMYVSHVQRVDNYLLFLAGEANSSNAIIYKVYLPTFEVIDASKFSTHPSAMGEFHATLTSAGKCVFINGKSLKIYDTYRNTYRLLPLDFIASAVFNYEDQLIVLGQSHEVCHYAVFNSNDQLLSSGQLTLPSSTALLIDALLTDQYLYLISFDPKYSRFSNYLTVYDSSTGELLYSLGIKPFKSSALLDINFY